MFIPFIYSPFPKFKNFGSSYFYSYSKNKTVTTTPHEQQIGPFCKSTVSLYSVHSCRLMTLPDIVPKKQTKNFCSHNLTKHLTIYQTIKDLKENINQMGYYLIMSYNIIYLRSLKIIITVLILGLCLTVYKYMYCFHYRKNS